MYTEGYGYRSRLNQSMVRHLRGIAERMKRLVPRSQDVVVDIGRQRRYAPLVLRARGAAPGPGSTDREAVPPPLPRDVQIIPDFFSAELFRAASATRGRKP